MKRRPFALIALFVLASAGCSQAQVGGGSDMLRLERSVALAGVKGRIDHLALDPARHRLFVAELGNGSVDAVALDGGAGGRIAGLDEPQGLAFLAAEDELAVACGGDGSLRFYDAATLAPRARLALGGDADNLRVDPASGMLVVGVGEALAIVDPRKHALLARIALPAHPEGFQVDGRGAAFVNLPDAGRIVAVDLAGGRVTASWPASHGLNFPMALDRDRAEMAIVYRFPARLVLINRQSGAVLQDLPACGDADDLFRDLKRDRLYAICGSGKVEVFRRAGSGYASAGRIDTRSGARTGLFDAAGDRLYVAARAAAGRDAAILVYAPAEPGG